MNEDQIRGAETLAAEVTGGTKTPRMKNACDVLSLVELVREKERQINGLRQQVGALQRQLAVYGQDVPDFLRGLRKR